MRRLLVLATASAALAGAAGAAAFAHDPLIEPAPCDYGDSNPLMPQAGDGRLALYDLMLGQRLRRAEAEAVAAALRQRFPGEATEAFLAIYFAPVSGSDAHRDLMESIVARHGGSSDADLQREVARARFMLIDDYKNRLIEALMENRYVWIAESWRETADGRTWSELVDRFLADYRDRGPMFDEFVADVEMEAIFRDAATLSPGDNTDDQRFLFESEEARDVMRAGMRRIIARYGASGDERVQRVVAQATDMLAPYEEGPAARIPIQREIIARYRDVLDYSLRAEVGGAYHSLENLLRETGDVAGAEAVRRERIAFYAAKLDSVDCREPPAASAPALPQSAR